MPPDSVNLVTLSPTEVEMLVGLLVVLVKLTAIVPLVPTVIVTVAVWLGEVPSEAGVSVAEVGTSNVVVFVEVNEKTPAVPGVFEVTVITPAVVFVAVTVLLNLVFALIAFVRFVAAVVGVSL